MAMALLNENEISKALSHARASVELFDEFPAALALYAGLLFAEGQKEEAKQQLARLRGISPHITREKTGPAHRLQHGAENRNMKRASTGFWTKRGSIAKIELSLPSEDSSR